MEKTEELGQGRRGSEVRAPAPFLGGRPVSTERLEHVVEVRGDANLVVQEILQPVVILPLSRREQGQQVAQADAGGWRAQRRTLVFFRGAVEAKDRHRGTSVRRTNG